MTVDEVTIAGRDMPLSPVFDTYWRFAAKRQAMYLARVQGGTGPWTDDRVLRDHRFTNVFRASDRVSQYLLRQVIYRPDAPDDPKSTVMRVLLFKMFNRESTWEQLRGLLGEEPSFDGFSPARYQPLFDRIAKSGPLYSAAYVIPPPALGADSKHANHLRLLEMMMRSGLTDRIREASTLEDVFNALMFYPSMGRFLAYQFTIDLNYTPLLGFDEDDFVVAGPGAADGIRKCFGTAANNESTAVIRYMVDSQEEHFARLGLDPVTLFGRRLHLIDCQNLFCEVDKYARVVHPDVAGISGRTNIKQTYRGDPRPLSTFFPPAWGINDLTPNPTV